MKIFKALWRWSIYAFIPVLIATMDTKPGTPENLYFGMATLILFVVFVLFLLFYEE